MDRTIQNNPYIKYNYIAIYMNKTLLIITAVAVAAAFFAAAAIVSPLQTAQADRNNGCRNAFCIGVNGNQKSANNNDHSFNFDID
jgi:hypothetical protein